MLTLLLVILVTAIVAIGISLTVKSLSYSEKEEHLPVENYDLLKSKTPIKKTKKSNKIKN